MEMSLENSLEIEETLENIIKEKDKEIEKLKHNWYNLVSVLETQIETYKDSESEELQAMVQEDKSILFIMKEYEDDYE